MLCVCFHTLFWLFLIMCLIFHMKVLEVCCGLVWCYCFAERNAVCFWMTSRSSRNPRSASCNQELKWINIWTRRYGFKPLLLMSAPHCLPFKGLFQNVVFIGGGLSESLSIWEFLLFFSYKTITCFYIKFLGHYFCLSNPI